jgi:hypothetical protein
MKVRALLGAIGVVLAALALPAAPASATATHVGIVVEFGAGRVSTTCASAGGSGLDVLERKYRVLLGAQPPYIGFVLTINGTGITRPDDTHYWSYWRSSGNGGWTYSGSGAGSTTPAAGSVEGWSYVDGASSAPRPPSYTYAALCGAADPKPARTSSRAYAPPPPRPVTTAHKPTAHKPTETTRPQARAASPHGTASPARHRTASRATTSHPTPSATPSATPPSATPTKAPTNATSTTPAPTASPVARQSSGTGLPAWGTVLAVLVVVALGTVAWLRMRRAP